MSLLFRGANGFKKRFGFEVKGCKVLGEGKYGKVYLVREGEMDYAVKIIHKKKLKTIEDKEGLELEIEILSKCNHPHIIKIYESFEDKSYHYLVLESVSGGELFDRIVKKESYSEYEACMVVRNVMEALEYLHSMNICHRDLKPENLLLHDKDDDTSVTIADFGFANYCEEPLSDGCGTLLYVSPEILQGKDYKTECDIWSIGIITYILLCGYPPFYCPDQEKLSRKICRAKFRFRSKDWDHISPNAKDFIARLLRKDQDERLTATEALNHPWLKDLDRASMNPIPNNIQSKLREFRAKMLLTQALQGVIAVNRMRDFIKDSPDEDLSKDISEDDDV